MHLNVKVTVDFHEESWKVFRNHVSFKEKTVKKTQSHLELLISGRKPSIQTQSWQCLLNSVAWIRILAYDKTSCITPIVSRWRLQKVREASSIFFSVNEEIYIEIDEYNISWPIFVTWEGRSKEVFEVSKAKHFSPLIIEEHSDQFSHKKKKVEPNLYTLCIQFKIKPEFFVSFNCQDCTCHEVGQWS